MSTFNSHAAAVKYPKIERATAFITQNKIPFTNAVIGATNPNPDYCVVRKATSPVNVFEYVCEGEGEVVANGVSHKVSRGDCYVLIAGEEHEYRSNPKNPMKKMWVNYVADYIPAMLGAYGIKSGVYHCDEVYYFFSKLSELAEEGAAGKDDTVYLIAECVHSIIHKIARSMTFDSGDELGIGRALAAQVYEKLNLDELADELHISKSQLIRSFKKTHGTTPYEYFMTLKVNTAKVLLRDTKMQIREIAEKLSICDEHYFSALFKSRTGTTPRAYRSGRKNE